MIEQEDLVEIFDRFINDLGLWGTFKEWVEEHDYTVEELGFPPDE